MQNPELIIIFINILIILFAYVWLYPRVAGSDLTKIANYDFVASIVSIGISGILFWELNIEFYAIFGTLNWFWFALVTYLTLEIPMVLWYIKKYNVLDSIK